jgi:hypothetical protein
MKLRIVDKDGNLALYQGKRLEFDPSERDRAETIVWLVGRNATNGPFRLIEVA